jgi:hypothetical protein
VARTVSQVLGTETVDEDNHHMAGLLEPEGVRLILNSERCAFENLG